jgi:hypothetical protein
MRDCQAAIASGNFKAYAKDASAGWGIDNAAEPVEE